MAATRIPETRARLLQAAADLIAAAPGQDVPLRAICDRAGVRLPTLYHHFGSKEGLLEAVIEHGFDLYVDAKGAQEGSGDPIRDLRDGWDAHVAFGLANPGFYALMYGQVAPGRRPAAQDRPTRILNAITAEAAEQGRLVVDPEQAAAHVLATNVGVTLRQIVLAEPDPELSEAAREATIAAITGAGSRAATDPPDTDAAGLRDAATRMLAVLPEAPDALGEPEARLMKKWLAALARPAA